MADPEIRSDEKVLMRTQGVHVKSIPFEGILTSRRIILVDRAKNILPPKEIPLATVKEIETGENAVRDLTLIISIMAKTGETRQMILTFPRTEGGDRPGERDEWARLIRESASSSFGQVIRKVIPGADQVQRSQVSSSPYAEPAQRTQPKQAAETIHPIKKIIEMGFPEGTASSPALTSPSAAVPPTGGIVFCTRCGTKVSADSAFCNKCGSPVVAPAAIPQPVSRPAAAPVSPAAASRPLAEVTRTIHEDVPLQQSLAWDDDYTPAPAPDPVSRQSYGKPERKGFLAGILSPKKRVATPQKAAVPAQGPGPASKPRGSLMPGKKTLIAGVVVLIVIVALVIGALFVYPMLTSGTTPGLPGTTGSSGSTGSSATPVSVLSNSGVASITVKETTPPTIPVTGVWVRISYIGSYEGTYGMPSDLQQIPGASAPNSGDQTFEVVNATGTIQATIQKEDSSTKHDLLVEIYKNGKLLTSGKSGDAFGRVTISTSAGAAAPVTTPAKAGNTTATAKPTTVVTTVKTTAPSANTTAKSP